MTAALAVTLGVAVDPVHAAPVAAKPKADKVASRPEVVSARVSARAQGSRVEVEGLREETSTTWVNPDGTMTTEAHAGQIRFRGSKDAEHPQGAWRDVDLTMVEGADGTVGPAGHPVGLSLAGATKGAGGGAKGAAGTDLAKASEKPGKAGQAREVTFGWGGSLGKPTLSGTKATYKDVQPGVDLVVDARRSGFESDLAVNTPQALAAMVASAGSGPVAWQIPVKTHGLTARAEKDGSVSFVDADGQVASRLATPVAWDAEIDPRSGEHASTSPVAMTVTQQGKGRALLTLTPDQGWLTDPGRVFPVTIDPTYASGTAYATADTYVSSAYPTATYSTSTELRVGTYNDGGDKYRSFLTFPISGGIAGKDIVSASLSLFEFHSYSCTASPFYVYNALGTTSSTNWNNQPAGGTQYGSLSVAKGYSSSCAGGRVSVPITSMMQWWATSGSSAGGMRLHASETSSTGWKKFYSSESTADPAIIYTYNRKPNAATAPTSGGATYNGAKYVAYGSTPFTSTATDPDGSSVAVTTEVHTDTTGSAASLVSSCSSALVAPAAPASCTPAPAMPDNKQLYARTAVKDDRGLWNGTWSAWTTFRTALTKPATPTVDGASPQLSCAGHANGSWDDTVPAAAVPCTVTVPASPAPGYNQPITINAYVDGAATPTVSIATNQQAGTFGGISVPNTPGGHSVKVSLHTASTWSTDPSAVTSFGWGASSLTSPSATSRVTTTGKVAIVAAGPPRLSSPVPAAKVRWRVASSGQDETTPFWNDATTAPVTVTDNGAAGISVTGSWDTMAETLDATDTDPDTAGVQTIALNPRVPVLLDVQVCLTYTSGTQCTWSQSKNTVMRVPHAFGNGFPTSAAGPGQVALFTGEFNTDATDVSVPGYTGSISLSRSHSTYGNAPGAATDAVTGVFGPGWTAALDGSDAGLGGLQAVDSTRNDGTIAFVDTDGTALVYQAPCTGTPCKSRRTTAANLTAGRYSPVDEDTALSGTTLTVAGTGAATTLTLTEDDGTKTVFSPSTASQAPTATAAGLFSPTSVTEPGNLTTSYTRDGAGRVTRILAPIPPGTPLVGDHTSACPDPTVANPTIATPDGALPVTEMEKGCRALRISYADGTAVNGSTPKLVKQVSAELYNPATLTTKDCAGGDLTIAAGMARVPVACYGYDATNHLTSVKDPRTGLATSYTYGSGNQLTSITPAGQAAAPITLVYSTLEQRLKLTAVTRPQAAPLTGTANLTRILYRAPLSGTGVLPDLTSTAVDDWAQAKAPTYAAAVFGPDYAGTLTQAADIAEATASASDWSYADLSYATADGYTVNTASYGAGKWLRTSTDYDDNGNIVRQLDAGAIDTITTGGLNPGMADQYATKTVYNADIKDTTGKIVTPAGTLVTDTYGPARLAVLADGTVTTARPHTQTKYDEGAPNQVNGVGINTTTGDPWRLPTTETTTAANSDGTDLTGQTISTTTTEYGTTAAAWALGAPTKTTTGGISTVTVYDSVGRTIQARQPMSSGTDAGTTTTEHYTADSSATDSRCDAKPEWAGLPCVTGPASAAMTTGTAANGPATLPSSWTSGYSIWLAATTTDETSGTATRTSTTTMDAAGRATKTQTTSTIPGSTLRPAVYTHYDPATGQADYTGPVDQAANQGLALPGANKTTVYDAWGRPVTTRTETATGSYDTTTTTYDTAGRVATVTDPKGTTTTTWDGTDANGAPERRGLATTVTITRAGAAGGTGTLDFTGAYDPDGALTSQVLPGGITQTTTYDTAGEPTELRYMGQVTPVTGYDQEGNPTYGTPTPGTWLAWTQANDITGRVRQEYTGAGSSFDGTVPGVGGLDQVVAPTGEAVAYDRAYTYDGAGRLTTVKDRTATDTGTTLDPDAAPTTAAPCDVRAYTFDGNGRRTHLTSTRHPDGDCASTTGTTTGRDLGYSYDTADRPTTAATGTINGTATTAGTYTYDAFGRQTLIPATDAPTSAAGNITLGYHDDDLARTITQNSVTTTLDLDSGGRRVKSATVNGAATTVLERHYADGSDNPAWTLKNPGPSPVITRYAESLGGDLSATINADGSADLQLATLHGDVVTTVDIPAAQATGTPATGITGWSDYNEYGTPRDATATATVAGAAGYGWLGAKQRSTTTETAGLTLMGDRLYNATTGRFTSLDPEPGGNANAYTYPTDPINKFDLDGRWGRWKKWGKNVGRWAHSNRRALGIAAGIAGIGVCAFTLGIGCAVAGAIAAGASAYNNYHDCRSCSRKARWTSAGKGFAIGAVSGRASSIWRGGRYIARYGGRLRIKRYDFGIAFRSTSGRIMRGHQAAWDGAVHFGCSYRRSC